MTRAEIQPGVCGFPVVVSASSRDLRYVHLEIDTDCPAVAHLAVMVPQVDAYAELEPDNPNALILRNARLNLYCASCPVPAAMIKAVEVECGLADARDAIIRLASNGDSHPPTAARRVPRGTTARPAR